MPERKEVGIMKENNISGYAEKKENALMETVVLKVIHSIVLHGGFDGVLSVIGAIAGIYHHGFAARRL